MTPHNSSEIVQIVAIAFQSGRTFVAVHRVPPRLSSLFYSLPHCRPFTRAVLRGLPRAGWSERMGG